jgi:hypothetical protein
MSGACTAGQATATVKGNTTVKQDDAAGAKGTAAQAVDAEKNAEKALGLGEPDLTDSLLEEARKRMGLQLMARSSRRDALANNPGGGFTASSYSLLGK